MFSEAQQRDMRLLVERLLDVYAVDGPVTPLSFEEREASQGSEVVVVTLRPGEQDALVEWVNVFVLATHAAAITVEYVDQADHLVGNDIDEDRLAQLLSSKIVGVDLVRLANGSFWAKFSVDPRTHNGRRRVVAVIGLTGLVLMALAPPVGGAVTLGAAAVSHLNDIATPDTVPEVSPDELETVDPTGLENEEVHLETGDDADEQMPA